jgi:hypothetical protein
MKMIGKYGYLHCTEKRTGKRKKKANFSIALKREKNMFPIQKKGGGGRARI